MKLKYYAYLLVSVVLLSCSGAPVKAWEWKDPSYVKFDINDVKNWVPAPPPKDSTEYKKQLSSVLEAQKKRTEQDCERAVYEKSVKFEILFGAPYGPLNALEVNKLKDFMDKVRWDVDHPVHELKKLYSTDRPFAVSDKVKLCPNAKAEKTKSYPSGHAAIGRLFALILSDINPQKKETYMKRANEIAYDRVLGGVHFVNDTEQGKVIADRVWTELKKDPLFKSDLEKLKN